MRNPRVVLARHASRKKTNQTHIIKETSCKTLHVGFPAKSAPHVYLPEIGFHEKLDVPNCPPPATLIQDGTQHVVCHFSQNIFNWDPMCHLPCSILHCCQINPNSCHFTFNFGCFKTHHQLLHFPLVLVNFFKINTHFPSSVGFGGGGLVKKWLV